MALLDTLAYITKQIGDPETKWLTSARLRSAITQVYSDIPSLSGLVADTRALVAGSGLTGGGDLTADRTVAVDWGTTANKVRHGNDAAFTDARTPTSHAESHNIGGSDPVTPANIGAEELGAADDARDAAILVSCQRASNLSDVADAATAVANLGAAPALLAEVEVTAATTLALSHAGKLVRVNVASPVDVTVPPNASVAFPVGTQILLVQAGAGQVRVVPGAGVTIRSAWSRTRLATQYDQASLVKRATNEWYLAGGLVQ